MAFVEVCIYEVKPDRAAEFEDLVRRVTEHHRVFPGVREVRYMKRTHRTASFAAARSGEPAIRLTRPPTSITYVLYWELDDEAAHGQATKSGLYHFFKDFRRCLVGPPKMLLGERLE